MHRPSFGSRYEAQTRVSISNFAGAITAAPINDDDLIQSCLVEQVFESRPKRLFFVKCGDDHGNHWKKYVSDCF